MVEGTRGAPLEIHDLLPLALSRPAEAARRARAVLAADPGPYDASIAHQAAAIVLRDFGDVDLAVRELRISVRLARAAGSPDREADALASLALALVYAGRTSAALAAFGRALRLAGAEQVNRVRMRYGGALWILGRHREAVEELHSAVTLLRADGDTIWLGRALTFRALAYLALGATDRAETDFAAAEVLFAETSQELERAFARHNGGLVAFRSGDLPLALGHLDEAGRMYAALNASIPDLSLDRCAVLMTAGLPDEALDGADAAIHELEQIHGQETKKAELLLTAAGAALAAAEPHLALDRARAAHRLFGAQRRRWWHAHAGLLVLQARYLIEGPTPELLRQARRSAGRLDTLQSAEAPEAHLLAGRIALALGRRTTADRELAEAARNRHHGPALASAGGWLAEALRAEAAGDPRRLLHACRRGLDELDRHRLTLGASELLARATAHGAELAGLALRHTSRPRGLLAWSERWRATALAAPPARSSADELQADLAALRDVASRCAKAQARGEPATGLRREQRRLEDAVRARTLRSRGSGGPAGHAFDVAALLARLGTGWLIQIVDVDGALRILLCGAGRVRGFTAGRTADAAREIDFARFGLKRLAHPRSAGHPRHSLDLLEETGRRLEEVLLGPITRHLGDDGPVVVVPPGRLHAVPWALLPSLRDRVVSVAPSASAWMRAHTTGTPRTGVVLISGPGLETGGAEVKTLAEVYPGATVLTAGDATTERVLHALDGAGLAHIAAHGTFRADSPMFSSILVEDGPLTVYDLGRLRRAPAYLVLPVCDSGLQATVGADELLGLASTLLPLGVVGIVGSVVPVNDRAVVPLMLELHERLRSGHGLAESLRDARHTFAADPVVHAAGLSFVVLGAG